MTDHPEQSSQQAAYPPPPYPGQQPYPGQGHEPAGGYGQGYQGYQGQFGSPMGSYPGGEFGVPPAYGGPQNPSMWARLGARILDGLLIGVPFAIVSAILTFSSHTTFSTSGSSPLSSFGSSFQASFTGPRIALSVLQYVVVAVYYILMIARSGSTVGKKVVGVKVVAEDGSPATMHQSVIRWAVFSGPSIIPFVGSLWFLVVALSPFFDSARRQGFHDKAAHTVVVQR